MDLPPPLLRTRRLVLRPPTPADVPAHLAFLRGERDGMKDVSPRRPAAFFTAAFQRRTARRAERERRKGRGLSLLVFRRGRPGEVIGHVAFSNVVRGAAQSASLGFSLGALHRGKGLMTESLRAALACAFGPLRLHRVQAAHMPRNRASGRVLRRLGFRREGLARDYLLIDGRWEDHVLTGLVRPRWRPDPADPAAVAAAGGGACPRGKPRR